MIKQNHTVINDCIIEFDPENPLELVKCINSACSQCKNNNFDILKKYIIQYLDGDESQKMIILDWISQLKNKNQQQKVITQMIQQFQKINLETQAISISILENGIQMEVKRKSFGKFQQNLNKKRDEEPQLKQKTRNKQYMNEDQMEDQIFKQKKMFQKEKIKQLEELKKQQQVLSQQIENMLKNKTKSNQYPEKFETNLDSKNTENNDIKFKNLNIDLLAEKQILKKQNCDLLAQKIQPENQEQNIKTIEKKPINQNFLNEDIKDTTQKQKLNNQSQINKNLNFDNKLEKFKLQKQNEYDEIFNQDQLQNTAQLENKQLEENEFQKQECQNLAKNLSQQFQIPKNTNNNNIINNYEQQKQQEQKTQKQKEEFSLSNMEYMTEEQLEEFMLQEAIRLSEEGLSLQITNFDMDQVQENNFIQFIIQQFQQQQQIEQDNQQYNSGEKQQQQPVNYANKSKSNSIPDEQQQQLQQQLQTNLDKLNESDSNSTSHVQLSNSYSNSQSNNSVNNLPDIDSDSIQQQKQKNNNNMNIDNINNDQKYSQQVGENLLQRQNPQIQNQQFQTKITEEEIAIIMEKCIQGIERDPEEKSIKIKFTDQQFAQQVADTIEKNLFQGQKLTAKII